MTPIPAADDTKVRCADCGATPEQKEAEGYNARMTACEYCGQPLCDECAQPYGECLGDIYLCLACWEDAPEDGVPA